MDYALAVNSGQAVGTSSDRQRRLSQAVDDAGIGHNTRLPLVGARRARSAGALIQKCARPLPSPPPPPMAVCRLSYGQSRYLIPQPQGFSKFPPQLATAKTPC